MNAENTSDYLSASNLFAFIYRYRKLYFYALIIAFLVSIVCYSSMPKTYRSFCLVFPTRTNMVEKVLEDEDFGYEIQAEWAMEILQSAAIKDSMLKKFNLAEHYKIDSTKFTWQTNLDEEYYSSFKVEKSLRKSLSLIVVDEDPVLAAQMANEWVSLFDKVRDKILEHNKQTAYLSIKKEYENKALIYNEFVNNSNNISGKFSSDILKPQNNALANDVYLIQYQKITNDYYDAKNKMNDAEKKMTQHVPAVYVISKAVPNYKPISPRGSVVFSLIFIATFFLLTVFLIVKDQMHILRSSIK